MTVSEERHKHSTTYLLPFEKYHGLGNDFVIINANHLPELSNEDYEKNLTRKICNRNLGIGADGLIIIDQVKESEEAIRSWRFYNADGSIAEMCGNGIRCAAKYIYEHGLSGEDTLFKIETLAGDIGIELLEDSLVKVNMGRPKEIVPNQEIVLKDSAFRFPYTYVSMGNPHVVSFWDLDLNQVKNHGPAIEVHEKFPNKTNVEFAKLINPTKIELIVWERGCGFTQACGTGACATAVAAIASNLSHKDQNIEVILPGGSLIINWDSVTEDISMTGEAQLVFIGYYNG